MGNAYTNLIPTVALPATGQETLEFDRTIPSDCFVMYVESCTPEIADQYIPTLPFIVRIGDENGKEYEVIRIDRNFPTLWILKGQETWFTGRLWIPNWEELIEIKAKKWKDSASEKWRKRHEQ